jgi:hypothetical protein
LSVAERSTLSPVAFVGFYFLALGSISRYVLISAPVETPKQFTLVSKNLCCWPRHA